MSDATLKPFNGLPGVPQHVRDWKVGKVDDALVQSGQWMARRSYEGGPVEYWLHIADESGK